MKRLLVLSCSAGKVEDPRELPAIARYKSPSFYIVRKFLRENQDPDLIIWILSAKYGLIGSEFMTETYDFQFTPAEVEKRRGRIERQAEDLIKSSFPDELPATVFCYLSQIYLSALKNVLQELSNVVIACGTFGQKNKMLKNWLLS